MQYFKLNPKLLTSKKSISSSMDEQEKQKIQLETFEKKVITN